MIFKVYIFMPFQISSQRKSPTFHFSWKLFLIDKNICELYKTEKPTTCVVSAPKNCSERSCSHEFQSSKKTYLCTSMWDRALGHACEAILVTDAAEKQECCRSGLDALALRRPSLIPRARNARMLQISPAHTKWGFAKDPLCHQNLI